MLVVFGGSVRAEELGSAPGWQLNRVQEQKADNDFTYSDGRVFFSLKPPDARPAITVDNRTADRLRSGEVGAEATYTGQTRGLAQGKDEEFVYGSKSNGLVLAEPILSTLTAADGGRIDASVPVAAEPPPRAAGSESSSLSGLSSGSSGIGGRTFASAATNRPRNTSGASAPAPAAAPAAAAAATGASGPPPVVDPRLAIAEANRNAPPPKAGTFQGGVSAANEAGGFGIKKKDKDGKSKEDENFIVWPNGEPDGKTDGKAKCGASVYKLYDQASVVRLQAPEGCQNMRVRAWGAGGGGGGYDDEGTQTGGKGGGGAFVYTAGLVDTKKFDVVIVIGEAGAAGHGKSGGVGGSIGGGGKGGSSAGGLSGGGGAGGGYSGVFLLERAKVSTDEKKIDPELAIVIAAGGGGGSSSGDNGGGGGITRGGGNGATQSSGGPKNGNSEAGESLKGGAGGEGGGVNNSGGGGGGGLFGGGGGGAASQMDGPSIGGGGGSSFYRYLDNFETATADGPKAGNQSFKDRGTSGDAGKPGKVIIEFY